MLIVIIILIVLIAIYFNLPFWLKLIILAINSFIPDPIPILDEVMMGVAIVNDIKKFNMITKILVWMRKHIVLSIFIILGVVLGAAFLLIKLAGM